MIYPQDLDSWHAQIAEPVLDPDREIVDPHHHLWPDRLGSQYELAQLWADTGCGHNVRQTVFIECGAAYDREAAGRDPFAPVNETRYVQGLAEQAQTQPQNAQIAAIVAHADLRLPPDTLAQVLAAHQAASPLFRGIRHAGAFDPQRDQIMFKGGLDAGLYLDPDFQRGLRILGAHGLSYDTWHFHPQNAEFLALVQACPDTTIVLNHFGTPMGTVRFAGQREARFAQWQREMEAIAACPNVVAKLGGLAMPVNGFGWDGRAKPPTSDEVVAAQGHYYQHMLQVFGPERCMFESNFPVDKLSVGYRVYWNAMKKIAAPLPEPAQEALFAGTARRIYRL